MQDTFDAPLGGEAWAKKPRSMPYDRPPQFAEVDAGLNYIFKQLRNPPKTKQMLNLMKAGVPVDLLAEQVLTQGFSDGKFGAPALLQMVGPTIAMMWRMAESVGIRPMTTQDANDEVGSMDIDPTELMMFQKTISDNSMNKSVKANDISKSELLDPTIIDRPGFMSMRPKQAAK
jgi:hypothetical protein